MTPPPHVDRFTWERQLLKADDVSGTLLLVLLVLASHMDRESGRARPSQATIAAAAGLSDRAVRGHLATAVESGWLLVESRGHRRGDGTTVASTYRATTPETVASTGTGEPVEDKVNRNDGAGREDLNRNLAVPQPEAGGTSTGTGLPPISLEQSEEQRERATHEAARRLVTAKGDTVDDEITAHLTALEPDYNWVTLLGALKALEGKRYIWPSDLRRALDQWLYDEYEAPGAPGTYGPSPRPDVDLRPPCPHCDGNSLVFVDETTVRYCECHPLYEPSLDHQAAV